MNKLYYSEKQIKELEVIGQGDNSVVYKDPNNYKALKIYKIEKIGLLEKALFHTNNQFLQSHNAIVPEGKVFINEELSGFYAELVEGYTIFELQKQKDIDLNIKDVMIAYSNAFKNVEHFSAQGYRMWDLHSKNIMYDTVNHRMAFIDIDTWYKCKVTNKNTNSNIEDFVLSVNLERIEKKLGYRKKRNLFPFKI